MMRTPRAIGWAFALTLALMGEGCHLTFDVGADGQAMVPGNSLLGTALMPLGPLGGQLGAFDISQSQDFQNQGVSKSQIQSVRFKSIVLTISSPAGETFDFLTQVQFQVSASGLPTVTVAQKNPVPSGVTSFAVDIDDVDIASYVTAPSMSVTTNAGGTPPPEDTTIDVSAVFLVTVQL